MVEVRVEVDEKREGCNVSCNLKGNGADILEESYSAIHGIVANIKETDEFLYVALMGMMAHDDSWMCKEGFEEEEMQRAMSKMTDKSVIN